MDKIVIGKRIVFGQIVMGIMTAGAFVWETINPDVPIPAGVLMAAGQAVVGIGQLVIVNRFGVTLPKN